MLGLCFKKIPKSANKSRLKNIFRTQWLIRTILDLQDNSTRLQRANSMPLADRDIHSHYRSIR